MRLRLSTLNFLAWGVSIPTVSEAWTNRIQFSRGGKLSMAKDLHEFDYLLREGASSTVQSSPRRRLVQLGGDEHKTILASTVAFPSKEAQSFEEEVAQQQSNEGETGEYDPYADLEAQVSQAQQFQEKQQQPTLENRLKNMDLQDIIVTFFIPGVLAFAGARWTFNKAAGRLTDKAETELENFASEMVYHDGDFEEMKMCYSEYSRKLMWMGPAKGEAMIKRYLEMYAKKRTVSPQAISSLSHVFTMFKLSEAKAADILVSLCRQMGTDKISSAGKLLFFGSRILKSDEGKAALLPIKELIMSTYRDEAVAETLVETSQQAMGEAAYRATVLAGGKNQKTLPIGWEVLGLTKEAATSIFQEEAAENFVSDREAMYGGQTQKYDSKGRRLDKDGKLENPEEADDEEESETEEASSNVYHCTECGYTLFIAQGREFKFYGDDFACPECGAPKDKFKAGLEEA